MKRSTSKASRRTPIADWNRAGRALRLLDADRFQRVLELAEKYVEVHQDCPPDPESLRPKVSRSESRARKRRAAFRVIQGGLGAGGGVRH